MTLTYPSRPMALVLFSLVTLALTASLALAQGGSLELTITDEQGKKLKDVSIRGMAEDSSEVLVTGSTNKKGLVTVKLPAAGFYAIEMSKDGFPTQHGRVEIREAMNTTIALILFSEQTLRRQQAVDAFNAGAANLQTTGQEQQALDNFVKASTLDPNLADAHRLAAIVAANLGDLELAGKALDSFLALAPEGMPQVASAAYAVYRTTGRDAELPAVRVALQAANYAGDVAIGVFNEGVESLKDEGSEEAKEKAKKLFSEALLLDPQLSAAHRSLAALEFNDGHYEKALAHLDGLLAETPQHRDGNRMAFFSHAALGHNNEAVTSGTVWAKRDPNAAEEIAAKAAEFFENNQNSKAEFYADLALTIDPDLPYGQYTMGRVLAGAGRIDQAKTFLKRFIELAPNHPEAESARLMLAGL